MCTRISSHKCHHGGLPRQIALSGVAWYTIAHYLYRMVPNFWLPYCCRAKEKCPPWQQKHSWFYRAASQRRSPSFKWGELHPGDDEPILSWHPIPPTWLSWELCVCERAFRLTV